MKATLTTPTEPDAVGCILAFVLFYNIRVTAHKMFDNISSSVLYDLGLVFLYLALVSTVISQG